MRHLTKNIILGLVWLVFTAAGNIIAQLLAGEESINYTRPAVFGLILGIMAFAGFTFADRIKEKNKEG